MPQESSRSLILYDGNCALCQAGVRFLLTHESGDHLLFASLYSLAGQNVRERFGLRGVWLQTMILIEHNQSYLQSTAAIRAARYLRWPWNLLQWLIVIPAELRDEVYQWVARNRYRIFGRADQCLMPEPGWKEKFVDEKW